MADRRRSEELILLDTHIWVWAIDRSPNLREKHVSLINTNLDRLAVSAALWEVAMLRAKHRISHEWSPREWLEWSTTGVGIIILPILPDIASEAYELPGAFHDDPADRLIVATARVHDILLISEDLKIAQYPHVRVA